jgi:hypothetical protein
MNAAVVFAASMSGSMLGVLISVLPIAYVLKKKFEKSPMGAMFG